MSRPTHSAPTNSRYFATDGLLSESVPRTARHVELDEGAPHDHGPSAGDTDLGAEATDRQCHIDPVAADIPVLMLLTPVQPVDAQHMGVGTGPGKRGGRAVHIDPQPHPGRAEPRRRRLARR